MKIEQEGWTVIPGYPKYEINFRGDIRRMWNSTKPTIRIPIIKRGTFVIQLTGPTGKKKEERVHKLMQRTFMKPPADGEVLYHKNGNKQDNWINNLAYIERSKLGEMTGGSSGRKAVVKLNVDGEVVDFYKSAREAARNNFMSNQTIVERCNGKVKSQLAPDGFIYRWDDDAEYEETSVAVGEKRKRGRPRKYG